MPAAPLHLNPAGLPCPSCHKRAEEGILLAFKAGITNWDGVAAAWGLAGWEPGVPVCTWGGIQCSPFVEQGSRVTGM